MNIFDKVALYGIVPVIKIPSPEYAVDLAKALCAGGLPLMEVTMRNSSAAESIARIREALPHMLIGAGTVTTAEKVDAAKNAGAQFVVSPGFFPEVEARCHALGLDYLPACSTGTEIGQASVRGYKVLKFFPSEISGGVKAIKEFSGPYRDVRYIATSGIHMGNLAEYMKCPGVLAVGGSFMAPAALVEAKAWEEITARCRHAVTASMGFHIAHVGINFETPEESVDSARRMASLLDAAYQPGDISDFVSDMIECRRVKAYGAAGHIAIGTYNVPRARHYLQSKGVAFRQCDEGYDAATGELISCYMEETFGGMALHLLRHII